MTTFRRVAGVLICAGTIVGAGSSAFAGEWNKGHFNDIGGNLPAKDNGNSVCLFSGQDELDETSEGAKDGEAYFDPGDGTLVSDDLLWNTTPAGAHNNAGIRVQSPGQQVAGGVPGAAGAPGEACRGGSN